MSNYYKITQTEQSIRIIKPKKLNETKLAALEMDEFVMGNAQLDSYEEERQEQEAKKKILLEEILVLEQRKNDLFQEIEQINHENEEKLAAKWQEIEHHAQELREEQAKEGREQGFEEGYNQGYTQIMQEFEKRFSEIEEIIQTAYLEKEKIIQESEPILLKLSVQIARKVIQENILVHEQTVLEMIRQTLEQVGEKGEIILEVSPQDYQLLVSHREELRSCIPSEVELKIIPNRHASGHGCIIHTVSGSYDVTIDSQLNEIKKQLIGYFEEHSQEE